MRTVFVTGGSGYLGRTIIRTAVAAGDEVRALARSRHAAKKVGALGATPVHGDLNDDAALVAGMAGCDLVIHAAAWVQTWGDPKAAWNVTVEGTRNVARAAREAGVERLVHVSTEAVLVGGDPIVGADETWPFPTKPVGLYPATKGAAEREIHAAVDEGLHAVIVRPRAIWGRDDTVMAVNLVQAIDSGRFAWIDGGRPLTSTCHVDNVVEGIFAAADRGRSGGIYFLTDGEDRTIHAFFSAVLEALGVEIPSKSVPLWLAKAGGALGETLWGAFGIERAPPVTRTEVCLIGQEVTVRDALARDEIGYDGRVSFLEGLETLDVEAILAAARPTP